MTLGHQILYFFFSYIYIDILDVQVTHGFPQNPSPLFHSTQFKIENRPGLEDQTIEDVMAQLDDDLGATQLCARRTSRGPSAADDDDGPQCLALATWLSDWHLIWFLSTTGLISDVGGVANLLHTCFVFC